jgi:hypothetical protein
MVFAVPGAVIFQFPPVSNVSSSKIDNTSCFDNIDLALTSRQYLIQRSRVEVSTVTIVTTVTTVTIVTIVTIVTTVTTVTTVTIVTTVTTVTTVTIVTTVTTVTTVQPFIYNTYLIYENSCAFRCTFRKALI